MNTDITGRIEGCPFPQWYLEQGNELGVWTPEEVATVEAVLRPVMQSYYDRGFGYATNFWRIWKSSYRWEDGSEETLFTAVKRTWETGGFGGTTAERIAEQIAAYYARPIGG